MPFSVVSGARMPTPTSAARQASSTTTCGRVTTARGRVVGRAGGEVGRGPDRQFGAEPPQHGVAEVPLGRDHPGDADRAGEHAHVGLQLGRGALGRRDHERAVLVHQRHPRGAGEVGDVETQALPRSVRRRAHGARGRRGGCPTRRTGRDRRRGGARSRGPPGSRRGVRRFAVARPARGAGSRLRQRTLRHQDVAQRHRRRRRSQPRAQRTGLPGSRARARAPSGSRPRRREYRRALAFPLLSAAIRPKLESSRLHDGATGLLRCSSSRPLQLVGP